MAGQLKIVSCLLRPSTRRLCNCNRKPCVLRYLQGINPFPEVNQIYISCFHCILHHCKYWGFFASTRMDIGNFEVQSMLTHSSLDHCNYRTTFWQIYASGCRTGCTERQGVQAAMWHQSRYSFPPAACVSLAPWRKGLSQGIKTGRMWLLWHRKENLLK